MEGWDGTEEGRGVYESDEALEDKLEKVVRLFSYLSDKDIFAEFYKKQLAKRLLLGCSAGEDAEKLVVARLKKQCGAQFTSKLEGMAIVVTGTLEGMGRDEARAAITTRGGKSPGSVSKKATALVAGENAGSKLTKAEELGIPVLDLAAFERLLATGELPE